MRKLAFIIALSVHLVSCGVKHKAEFIEAPLWGAAEIGNSQWPAVANLSIQGKNFCTGILVASDKVLAAAHCFHQPNPTGPADIMREISAYNRYMNIEINGQNFQSFNIDIPWEYQQQVMTHAYVNSTDLALIDLLTDVPSTLAKPVALASDNDVVEMKKKRPIVTAVGFGRDEHGTSGHKKQTSLNYVKDDNQSLTFKGNQSGVCKGDSGGPVFYTNLQGKTVLMGILNLGSEVTNQTGCYVSGVYSPPKTIRAFLNAILFN